MNKREKGNLLGIIVVLGFFGLLAVGIIYTRYINPLYLVAMMLLAQQAYLIPTMSKWYHELQGYEAKWTRFIPMYNEYEIFPTWVARVTFVSGIIQVILVMIGAMPVIIGDGFTALVSSVLGDARGMDFPFYCLLFAGVLFVVTLVPRAIGFIEVKRNIDRIYVRNFGRPTMGASTFDKTKYFMLCLPIVRVMGLWYVVERLRKMIVFNELVDEDEEEFVQAT